jgi:hypothetical protein
MSTNTDPIVGTWYEHLERGQKFEVIDFDEDRGVVEIRYADGDIDEMDLDEWHELEIEPIEAPEDWSDTVEEEAPGDVPEESEAEDWTARPTHHQNGFEDEEEVRDEDGEWGHG